MQILPDDWVPVFAPEVPLLELIVRGAVLYSLLLFFMRITLRRSAGSWTTMDLVFFLLLTNAASRALGDPSSIADAAVVIATLLACDFLLNFLSYGVPFVEKLISPPPLEIVRDGRLLRRNMRREFLTEEELMHHLRQQGLEELREVKCAHIEADGSITVIRNKDVGSQDDN